MTAQEFLGRLRERKVSAHERAVALLWWIGRENPARALRPREIASIIESAGYPAQNLSRLTRQLVADRRTTRAGEDARRLHPRARLALDKEYAFALTPPPLGPSDTVLPRALFAGTRGYIERVVEQINKSYDAELWDCCTVMCRRLLETLIIEVYEKLGRADDIKGADGQFKQLSDLINIIAADTTINLGRNAVRGLKDFKELGDLSAHNRRFNAHREDIDRVRNGLRVAAEELLHLAGLRGTRSGPADPLAQAG